MWILSALIRIFAELLMGNGCKCFAAVGLIITVSAIVEWVFHGFVWYILVIVRTPKCTNVSNYIVLGIYFLIFFFILGTLIVVFLGELFNKLRRMRYSQTLETVYRKIETRSFDLESYLKFNKKDVDMAEIKPFEFVLIREISEFVKDEHNIPKFNECTICISDFDNGEKYVNFPCCNHNYHYECLEAWLKTKLDCPVCKGGFRSNMLRVY
jgi:Ring finger domain